MHDNHGFLLVDALFAMLITTIIISLLSIAVSACHRSITVQNLKGDDIDVQAIVEVTKGLYPD